MTGDTIESIARLNRQLTERARPQWDNWYSSDSSALLCPHCNDSLLHLGTPQCFPDRDAYDSPAGTRGEFIAIPLFCECGKKSSLLFGNHKGNLFVSIMKFVPPNDSWAVGGNLRWDWIKFGENEQAPAG